MHYNHKVLIGASQALMFLLNSVRTFHKFFFSFLSFSSFFSLIASCKLIRAALSRYHAAEEPLSPALRSGRAGRGLQLRCAVHGDESGGGAERVIPTESIGGKKKEREKERRKTIKRKSSFRRL